MSHITEIHQNALIADAHFDLTYDIANRRERGQKKVFETHYLEGIRKGGFDLIVSSLFVHDYFLPEMGLRKALDQISFLFQEMDETPGVMTLCKTPADVKKSREDGCIGIMLSFEGAEPLQNDINLVRVFYELGVRGIGFTWSRRNYVGDGAFFRDTKEGRKGGLTSFGVELIEVAEELGMFIDVSHLNDEGFWDVMKFAKKPVIASHSNCRALKNTMRNITDEQIQALAEKGGMLGMNAASAFIGDDSNADIRLTADDLIQHIDHIVELVGVEHVGLGLDLCDSLQNYLSFSTHLGNTCYDVVNGHQSLPDITAGLLKRGYSDDDIRLILGGNFMRILEATLS